jgi:hypothetical protein
MTARTDNFNSRIFDIHNALASLYAGKAAYIMTGTEYSGLEWEENNTLPKPTMAIIQAEIDRLQEEYDSTEYQRRRAPEYPDPTLYLDAVVKGDETQTQAYIDACLAVKAKYPKP